MSATTITEIPFPALTLGWREATHGRRFAEFDPHTLTSYCTECLDDVTNNIDEQKWHVCATDAAHIDSADVALARRLYGPAPELVHPYGERGGLPLVRWGDVANWPTKGAATRAARMAGVSKTTTAVKVTSPLSWGWVLAETTPDGPAILTELGLAAAMERRASEHRTRTYTRNHRMVSYNVNSHGMTGWRDQFETIWVCTCGNGGFGNDRDRASARRDAKWHREDPSGFPGRPWENQSTINALRAS